MTVQIKENSYKIAVMIPITDYENIQGNSKYVGSKLTDFAFIFFW